MYEINGTNYDIAVLQDQIEQAVLEASESMGELPEKASNDYIARRFSNIVRCVNERVFWSIPKAEKQSAEMIEAAWRKYTELCYRFYKRPTILQFSVMTGIDREWIGNVKNGVGAYENAEYNELRQILKDAYTETESAVYDGAIESGIPGCMFALKCCYGYQEQPQQIQLATATFKPTKTAAQIAAGLELPEIDSIEQPDI